MADEIKWRCYLTEQEAAILSFLTSRFLGVCHKFWFALWLFSFFSCSVFAFLVNLFAKLITDFSINKINRWFGTKWSGRLQTICSRYQSIDVFTAALNVLFVFTCIIFWQTIKLFIWSEKSLRGRHCMALPWASVARTLLLGKYNTETFIKKFSKTWCNSHHSYISVKQ